MILAIKQFFEEKLSLSNKHEAAQIGSTLELASAALMFELMRSDANVDAREREILSALLRDTFKLENDALESLVALAENAATQATSLFEFTNLVNEHYNYEQRVQLIENLWTVAFADKRLDRYEEHLIRKVSDLIYINHSDFIRTKLRVKERMTQQ